MLPAKSRSCCSRARRGDDDFFDAVRAVNAGRRQRSSRRAGSVRRHSGWQVCHCRRARYCSIGEIFTPAARRPRRSRRAWCPSLPWPPAAMTTNCRPFDFVAHRRRLAAGGQPALPQLAPGFDVEGAQVVVRRRADEDEPAVRDDRSAHVRHAERRGRARTTASCRGSSRASPASGSRCAAGRRPRAFPRAEPCTAGRTARPASRGARRRECRSARAKSESGQASECRACIEPVARHERHDHRHVIDGGDHQLTFAVERRAAPVDAAGVTRRQDRALQARRREDAFRAIVRDQVATLAAIVEGEAPRIVAASPPRARPAPASRETAGSARSLRPRRRTAARAARRPRTPARRSRDRTRTACRSSLPAQRRESIYRRARCRSASAARARRSPTGRDGRAGGARRARRFRRAARPASSRTVSSPVRSPPKKSGLAEPVGTNTRPRPASTDSIDQAFAAPVRCATAVPAATCGFLADVGIGSHDHSCLPLRTSNARTMPRGISTPPLSPTAEPTMTMSR